MDPIVVDIPGVGPVEFPATMSQADIDVASKRLYDEANKEPVVEKESPELMGYLGAGAGAVGAAGDVIYSKGRPLIRLGEKMLGMQTEAPPKPRTFLDPSTVAEKAIERRMPVDPTTGGAVKTWAETQHAGEFLGGKEYSEADKIKKAAMDFEAKNPGQKILPGSLLAVPEEEAKRLSAQKAELAAAQDKLNQAEVQKVAQTRAERLGERADLKQKVARKNIASGAGTIATKVGAPILGGYELGSQSAQAYNRLTRPDLTARDVASGAVNVAGAGAGALSMLPGKYRIPAAILAQGAGAVANWLDKRNPREEPVVEQKAAGGLAGFAKGSSVIKKAVSGFLEHTPKKPNELVGTRFKTTDLGGLLEHKSFDPNAHLGAKMLHRPYDLSSRNQLVEEVSGHKLINPVKTEGGQGFGRDIENQAIGLGGASNKSINDRILKRVDAAAREGNGQVFNTPSTMGYGSEAFSMMPISIQLDLLRQRELPKSAIDALSDQVRALDPKKFANFVGFDHPEVEKQLLEGGFGLGTTPGKLRIAASDRLGLKGRTSNNQALLDYNLDDLYQAIRDPELRNVPPGYMGQNVMEAQPFQPGFDFGKHSAYDSGDRSKYAGRAVNAPISIWMPDTYKEALATVRAAPKTSGLAPGHQRAMARNILGTSEEGVAQTITPQVVDNLGRFEEAVKSGDLDANDLEAIHKFIYGKDAFNYAGGGLVAHFAAGGKIPEAVVKAYKLFKTKQNAPGELYPLFVNANKSVPIGEWVPAEVGPVAASGKVKSKLGELAYRPGWHAGDLPVATHIGGKSEPGLKAPDFRRPDEVWAEVEMPADVDWQEVANQRAKLNKAGKIIPSTAHITDQIPEGGHYRYKTSPNMQGNWLIGGGMKVNKVLTDEEVQAINEAAGVADLPRFTKFDEKAMGGLVHLAAGGLAFNPQGADYDYQTALAHGMGPDGTGENQGHWGSVAPTSDDERALHGLPEDSYVVLKGKNHPTFHKAEAAEQERGFKIVKVGDRYYSIPK
jgi:hypothetical protein